MQKQNKMRIKKAIILIFLIVCSTLYLTAQTVDEDTNKSNFYTNLGAGVGVFSLSEQPSMKSYKLPFHLILNVGNRASQISYFAQYEFNTQYKQDFIAMKNQNIAIGVKYSLTQYLVKSETSKIGLFAALAPNYWKSELYYIEHPNYFEKDSGFGLLSALGCTYKLNDLKFGLQVQYNVSITDAEFFAGNLDVRKVQTGGFQSVIFFSYDLNFN